MSMAYPPGQEPNKIDIYGSAIPSRSDPRAFTAYAAAVMAAAEYGERGVESNLQSRPTKDGGFWLNQYQSPWDWSNFTYRIAPSSRPKKFVTWRGPDDVPKGPAVWIRLPGGSHAHLVTEVCGGALHFGEGQHVYYSHLAGYQWSPDRIAWADCTVEVES